MKLFPRKLGLLLGVALTLLLLLILTGPEILRQVSHASLVRAAPSSNADLCGSMPPGSSGLLGSSQFWQGTNGLQIGCKGRYSGDEITLDLSRFESTDFAKGAITTLMEESHTSKVGVGDEGYEYKDPSVGGYVVYWTRSCYVGYAVTSNLDLFGQTMQLAQQADKALKLLGACSNETQGPPYRIRIEQLGLDSPKMYQPLKYRLVLEEKDETGAYQLMAGEIITLTVPVPAGFARYYEVSDCPNCAVKDLNGKQYAYEDFTSKYCVPECLHLQNIGLKTNKQGEATITFYLDMAQLASKDLVPTKDKPLIKIIQAVYAKGAGSSGQVLARSEVTTNLQAIGIIEGIYYTWASYRGENTQETQRKIINLSDLKEDKNHDRVYVQPGSLLYVGDTVRVDACDLPPTYGPQDNAGLPKPSAIAVQMRFFDGLRGMVIVSSDLCQDQILIGQSQPDTGILTQIGGVKTFVYWASLEFVDVVIESALGALSGIAGEAYSWYDLLGEDIPAVACFFRDRTVFVRLQSQVYLQMSADGILRVSTREGQPVIFTDALSKEKGVPVPAGQTAVIPASSIPELESTDPETAQSADIFLQQLTGKEGTVASQLTPPRIAPLLAVGGVTLCGFFGIILGGIGLLVWQRRRSPVRTQQPGEETSPRRSSFANRHALPTPARLVVVHGLCNSPLVQIPPEGLTIGRDATSLLKFIDVQVSRQHARIEFNRGAWMITDLGSANGTFVNRVQVQQKLLSPGDLIQVGEMELIFQVGQ